MNSSVPFILSNIFTDDELLWYNMDDFAGRRVLRLFLSVLQIFTCYLKGLLLT